MTKLRLTSTWLSRAMKSVLLLLVLCGFLWLGFTARAQALERLAYNHPGLVVDLGVGLWAWPVPCDADGDGDFDLIVSCPDKPHNGVSLFENADGDTARYKMPVFKPARRLSSTIHYVLPSYVNGQLRVLTPGAEHPNFLRTGLTEKVPLTVKSNFYKPKGTQPKGPKVRHNQWRYADYDGDGQFDLVVGIEDWSFYGWDDAWDALGRWTNGPLHGFVHVFRATGDGSFAEPFLVQADGEPVDTFGCPTPNFADFDGDGDLDLLCGEFLDGFTYFENTGTRTAPRYAAGRRIKDARGVEVRMELQMIVPIAFDWDKDGDLDLIVGDEDGRVAFVENTGRLASDRTPLFAQPVYFRQQADTLKCGALATPVGVDWDGDGDQDIVSGNTAGYLELFENLSGPGITKVKWAAPRRLEVAGRPFRLMAGPNGSIQGPAEAKWGYTTLNVADWDNDGLLDVVLNSILGEVMWLKNVGTRAAPKLAAPQPIEVEWNGPPPTLAWGWRRPTGKALLTQWRTTPVVFDFNQDGLPDLAMLDHEGYLAFFERAKSGGQLKSPRRAFVGEHGVALRLNSNSAGRSGRRKICVTDWDGDGRFDLLLNSANANLLRRVGARDGRWFFRDQGALNAQNIEGHDVSPAVVDFNDDGIPDFLGGAYWSEYDLKPPVEPGREAKVFQTDFGRVALAICFDVNFPDVWQQLADQGAELVVWPSAYSAGTSLQSHALNHHFYIVTSTLTRDCLVYDITGEELLYEKSNDLNVSRITLDLDRGVYHQNFNIEKRDKLLKEHGQAVKQVKWLDREQWFVLQATAPGVSARALAKQYGLEELRDYVSRSRREIDQRRGRGLADSNRVGTTDK